jgi:hypothetical protein
VQIAQKLLNYMALVVGGLSLGTILLNG